MKKSIAIYLTTPNFNLNDIRFDFWNSSTPIPISFLGNLNLYRPHNFRPLSNNVISLEKFEVNIHYSNITKQFYLPIPSHNPYLLEPILCIRIFIKRFPIINDKTSLPGWTQAGDACIFGCELNKKISFITNGREIDNCFAIASGINFNWECTKNCRENMENFIFNLDNLAEQDENETSTEIAYPKSKPECFTASSNRGFSLSAIWSLIVFKPRFDSSYYRTSLNMILNSHRKTLRDFIFSNDDAWCAEIVGRAICLFAESRTLVEDASFDSNSSTIPSENLYDSSFILPGNSRQRAQSIYESYMNLLLMKYSNDYIIQKLIECVTAMGIPILCVGDTNNSFCVITVPFELFGNIVNTDISGNLILKSNFKNPTIKIKDNAIGLLHPSLRCPVYETNEFKAPNNLPANSINKVYYSFKPHPGNNNLILNRGYTDALHHLWYLDEQETTFLFSADKPLNFERITDTITGVIRKRRSRVSLEFFKFTRKTFHYPDVLIEGDCFNYTDPFFYESKQRRVINEKPIVQFGNCYDKNASTTTPHGFSHII